ncbi:MAG: DUF4846 domain-containing protein [bacterium]
MKFVVIVAAVLMLLTSSDVNAQREMTPSNDSLIAWYHQHYPFSTMDDSIFTFSSEFNLPDGFAPLDSSSLSPFQNWVADFPLWHRWKAVGNFKKQKSFEPDSICRPVHLPYRGPRQSDRNIPIRILAEWLALSERWYDLVFLPHDGDTLTYDNFLRGRLLMDRRSRPYFEPSEERLHDLREFYSYMSVLMDHSSYHGLTRNCRELAVDSLLPGDLIIASNANGHKGQVWVMMHVIENSDGERRYCVATGCEQACDFYIPLLSGDRDQPWISTERLEGLGTQWERRGYYRLNLP